MESAREFDSSFVVPDVWYDDEEVYKLFAQIKRPRRLDPLSYDYKISFWRDFIINYAKHYRIVVITEQSLQKQFGRRFSSDGVFYYPLCLHQVLTEMMNYGLIKLVNQGGLISNIVNLGLEWTIKKPISLAWSFIRGAESISDELNYRSYGSPDTPLYIVELVVPLCQEFIEELKLTGHSLLDDAHVYIMDDYEKSLERFFEHPTTRMFINNQLREKNLIKFDSSGSISLVFVVSDKKPISLDNETLCSIAHLRKTMRAIINERDRLSSEIDTSHAKIKVLAREKKKREALNLLRRCKYLESELSRKLQNLTQLESLELKLLVAKDNKTVLHAFSEASSALKRTTGGLEGLEDVEKTMDEMAEVIEDANSLSDAISSFPDPFASKVDDADLTAELEELLDEEAPEVKKLPSPPSDKIGRLDDTEEAELLRVMDSLDLKDNARKKANVAQK